MQTVKVVRREGVKKRGALVSSKFRLEQLLSKNTIWNRSSYEKSATLHIFPKCFFTNVKYRFGFYVFFFFFFWYTRIFFPLSNKQTNKQTGKNGNEGKGRKLRKIALLRLHLVRRSLLSPFPHHRLWNYMRRCPLNSFFFHHFSLNQQNRKLGEDIHWLVCIAPKLYLLICLLIYLLMVFLEYVLPSNIKSVGRKKLGEEK